VGWVAGLTATGAGPGAPGVGVGAPGGVGIAPAAGLTLGAKGERVTRNFGPVPSPGLAGSPSFGVSFRFEGLGGCGVPGSVMRIVGQRLKARKFVSGVKLNPQVCF
jgi:hypothetical protein